MAAGVRPGLAVREPICEEDSPLRMGITYIPFVGLIYGLFQEMSLVKKITEAGSNFRLTELITVKNDYKKANIVNSLVCLAALIGGIASGILASSSIVFFGVGFMIGYAYMNINGLYENNKSLKELSNDPIIFMRKIY